MQQIPAWREFLVLGAVAATSLPVLTTVDLYRLPRLAGQGYKERAVSCCEWWRSAIYGASSLSTEDRRQLLNSTTQRTFETTPLRLVLKEVS